MLPIACATMSRLAFELRHIYPSPLNLVARRLGVGSLRQRFDGLPGEVMHDAASELRRTTLPRTPLNRKRARLSAAMCPSLRRSYRTKNDPDNPRKISKATLRN